MPALTEVAREKLQVLAASERRRELVMSERADDIYVLRDGKRLLSFSCNDYLGLSQHPQVKAAAVAAIEQYGTGAGASRLVTGNHPLYAELEAKLADWKGFEAALVFGSGYLANIGIITALMGRGDLILADRLVHACLIDGSQLSGAHLLRFKHNDMQDCERLLEAHRKQYRHCLIITDEVFSMDGDVAPLDELQVLASQHDAWVMADGAHSLTPSATKIDIVMGTLSKAFGGYGGYVCGSKEVIDYLATTSRSLMFSTGLPPAVVAAAIAALDIITQEPALLHKPLIKARIFTDTRGLPAAQSQIVPLVLGAEATALAAAKKLEDAGYLVAAIRPPTVPEGSSRLRFAFSAHHSDEDIAKLTQTIKDQNIL
jgi:8-amino-7-oxononanoate synthase